MKKTLSVISLGCFRNIADSEIIAKRFAERGYTITANRPNAETLLINTCGFIDTAKEESLREIREALKLKEEGVVKKIIVVGCLVQRYEKELKRFFPEVDQWQGVEPFSSEFQTRVPLVPAYIGFLKIAEGCLHACSYCAIPTIKGTLKSKPMDVVLKEVEYFNAQGVKELNIIGQDITSWGKDFKAKTDLSDLLQEIIKKAKNIQWIRLIYTHPQYISDRLLDLIAHEEKICKYVDLPIQHISDRILTLMRRGMMRKDIIRLITKIRKKIPTGVIRTSLIVGFPSETEEEFKELCSFIQDVQFDRLGSFIYSREENTPANTFAGQIHPATKARRYRQIMAIQEEIAQKRNARLIGKEITVLVEQKQEGLFIGRTQYDAYDVDGLVFLNKKGLHLGDFYRTKIVDAYNYDLVGM